MNESRPEAAIPAPPPPPGPAWSVCVREVPSGEVRWSHDADRVLRTASIGKIFLLVEVAARIEAQTLQPGERLTWQADEFVADSGLWHLMQSDSLPIADLCLLIGAVSDNLATNVLVRRLGTEAIRARARSLGCVDSALLDRVRQHRGPDHPPTLSRGRADELSAVLTALATGRAVSQGVSAQVLEWLAAGTDLSMVASAFGLDPLAHAEIDRGITLTNKTGTIAVVRADAGVVRGPRGHLAYAAIAEWPEDGDDHRDAVLEWMRTLGVWLRNAVR